MVQQKLTFEELLKRVQLDYYEETDPVELFHGAIEGYLSKLDPHSTYIRPEELAETQDRLQGSFEGIGIYFEVINNILTVLSPIEGSPAWQVGLRPGDEILKIDGKNAVGLKVHEITDLLKDRKGTTVKISVRREGEPDLLTFTIVRDQIKVPSIPYAFKLRPDVGYVKINRFSAHTARDLETVLRNLLRSGSKKLILDLRGNGGGYLEQAVAVANQFLEKGRLLVYTQGRHRSSRENHLAMNHPTVPEDVPLLVLVDKFSASASEIVAGAIQDYDRGLIVGHTTFGKGLVQKQFRLKNGGAVLLTIARYFTPSDRPIQRPFTEDHQAYREEGYDNYDPNMDPDSLVHKPVYYTRILKRKVFGEGGVTPDVSVGEDSLRAFERRLLQRSGGHLFLTFAKFQESEIARRYMGFETFLESYWPGGRELSAFQRFLTEQEIVFSHAEFRASVDWVKKHMRQAVAYIRWGREAEGRIRILQDGHVAYAIKLFDQAESLLADRSYSQGRTYYPGRSSSGGIR
ncbi:MAG: S41 family peptidase [bacterium]|nr:S41 family peptidase [bacterium]